MKTKLIMFFALLGSFSMLPVFASNGPTSSDSRQDKINLQRDDSAVPRSSFLYVEATTDHRTNLTVSVTDYTGVVTVQIFQGRGTTTRSFYVDEMGYEEINIGSIRDGNYPIKIYVGDVTFEGTLVKSGTGGR